MSIRTLFSMAVAGAAFACAAPGCSSSTGPGGTGGNACKGTPPMVADAAYSACTGCTASSATMCSMSSPVQACCTWLQTPLNEVSRGTGLHRYSSNDPTVNLGCLTTPPSMGTPMMATLTGYVWLFASGLDSQGVKVEVFKEGTNGAIDPTALGSYTTTAMDMADPVGMMAASWNSKCTPDGCQFRQYTIANIPTETPLVIKTSDAAGAGNWAELYDYNIYFANSTLQGGKVTYNASAVAEPDIGTVVSVAGGGNVDPTKGLLAGEVHDCGDVRLKGAIVETDQPHKGPIVYFNEDEGNPLPNPNVPYGGGTGKLSLWGAFNLVPGQPIRVTALGQYMGTTTLLGTYTVQVYPNAVTAISLRGRRPWQM
jgi:hypothetical protein